MQANVANDYAKAGISRGAIGTTRSTIELVFDRLCRRERQLL